MDAKNFLTLVRTTKNPNINIVGCFDKRVTIYSQQVRALNVIWALAEGASLGPSPNIAIVGGGIAGLTAAAAALEEGWRVTIFERQKLLHMQANAQERWIHPHIIDWPNDGADNARADLEFLNWNAGIAGDVVGQMRTEWDHIRSGRDKKQCTVHEGANVVKIDGKTIYWEQQHAGEQDEFDAIVLAPGFGWEAESKHGVSYWRNDGNRTTFDPKRRFLISGCGDGGLIDFLRLRLGKFDYAALARTLCDPKLKSTRDFVSKIEDGARDSYNKTVGTEQEKLNAADAYLSAEYPKFISTIDNATREEILGTRRADTEVVLNDRSNWFMRIGASAHNRFLAALLKPLYRQGDAKIDPSGDAYSVQFKMPDDSMSTAEQFDKIILRRGPVPALNQYQLTSIYKDCLLEHGAFKRLDLTRQRHYGDRWRRSTRTSSGPAPTASVEPDADPLPLPLNAALNTAEQTDFLIIAPLVDDRDALLSYLPGAELLSNHRAPATYHQASMLRGSESVNEQWVTLVIVTPTNGASIREVVKVATQHFNAQCVFLVGALEPHTAHRGQPGEVVVSSAFISRQSLERSQLREELQYTTWHYTVPWLLRAVRSYERVVRGTSNPRIRIGEIALGAARTVESVPDIGLADTLVCDPMLEKAAGHQMWSQYAQGVHLAIRSIIAGEGAQKLDATRAVADVALGIIRTAIRVSEQFTPTTTPSNAGGPKATILPIVPKAQRFLRDYRQDAFVGRELALTQLHEWHASATGPRCALLHAPAGMGKSALLARFYDSLITRGRNAWFFPISLRYGTDTEREFLHAMASFFARIHDTEQPSNAESLEALRRTVYHEYLCRDLPENSEATLIFDGIDETSNWKIDLYSFPAPLPKGLSIVVSVRAKHIDASSDPIRRQLGWDRPNEATFITLEPLRLEDVKKIVEKSNFAENVANDIYRRSNGDPLVVQLYARDLAEDRSLARFQAFGAAPKGLRGYFAEWWEHQKKLWGNNAIRKRQVIASVMRVLAMARGSMTGNDISAVLNGHDYGEITGALKDLHRFVLEMGDTPDSLTPTYVLSHTRFAWYYRDEHLTLEERESTERRFLGYGRHILEAILAHQQGLTNISAYIVRFYGLHLQQAVEKKSNGALDSLIALCDPRWMRASREIDPSLTGFAQDADRAFEALLKAENMRFQDGAAPAYIPQTIRALFCGATTRRTMATMPPGLVGQLLERGIWSTQAGLTFAKTSSQRTPDILYEIAPYLSAVEIDDALDIALAQQTVDAFQRAMQLLAPHLSDLQIQRARSAIAERPNAQNALKILDEHLAPPFGATAPESPVPAPPVEKPAVEPIEPGPLATSDTANTSTAAPAPIDPRSAWLEELSEVATKPVNQPDPYRHELLRLVRKVQKPWGDDLAAEFVKALNRIQQPDHRLAVCVESIEHAGTTMPEAWFVSLLEILIRDSVNLHWIADQRAAIRRFIRALPSHCCENIESKIRLMPASVVTLGARAAFGELFKGNREAAIWEEVVVAAESDSGLASVLMLTADELPGPLLPRAINVARNLDYPLGKANLLVELAGRLTASERERVLYEALDAAEGQWSPTTTDPITRLQHEQNYKRHLGQTMLHIALSFPMPLPGDVLRRCLRNIEDYFRRRELIDNAAFAMGAPPSTESLHFLREFVRSIMGTQERAAWLASIAPVQREEEKGAIIREALEAAQSMGDAQSLLTTVMSLLKLISAPRQLTKTMLANAIIVADQIDDTGARIRELARLWPLTSLDEQKKIKESLYNNFVRTGQSASPEIMNALQNCDSDQKKKIMQRIVDQICSLPPGWSNEPEHARQLTILGSSLGFDEESFMRALLVAERMKNIEYQAKALAALGMGRTLSVATHGAWNTAFVRVCDLARKVGNASALAWLATAAEEPLRSELANGAIVTLVRQTFDAPSQKPTREEIALVARVASDDSLPALLAKVFEISDASWRNSCLREVLIGLAGERQQHVLEIVIERFRTTTSTERRRFYTQIATVLPESEIEQALTEPSDNSLEGDLATADFISLIAPRLTESQRKRAVHIIRALTRRHERQEMTNALIALASHPSIASEVRAELFTDWRNQLEYMRTSDRATLLSHIEGSAPLIAALGGDEALLATAESLLQLQAGWNNP